jgi:hypothetical protein
MADWSLLTASEYILMPINQSWTRQFGRFNARVPENGFNGKPEMNVRTELNNDGMSEGTIFATGVGTYFMVGARYTPKATVRVIVFDIR